MSRNLWLTIYLCPGKPARPAPAELPQGRKAARVGSCSGAMFGLPFFFQAWILPQANTTAFISN